MVSLDSSTSLNTDATETMNFAIVLSNYNINYDIINNFKNLAETFKNFLDYSLQETLEIASNSTGKNLA